MHLQRKCEILLYLLAFIVFSVYGMTLGFPTIVIPAIQGGEGREPSDIVLNRDEISWFSKYAFILFDLYLAFGLIFILFANFFAGSINLICVPLGCLFSGLLTQPIGKRKAMQVCLKLFVHKI